MYLGCYENHFVELHLAYLQHDLIIVAVSASFETSKRENLLTGAAGVGTCYNGI
jgi:hypothetical protein